jgi:transcriptional regulator with XRE-family HTH domain
MLHTPLEIAQALGQRIKARRQTKGWMQAATAERAKVACRTS